MWQDIAVYVIGISIIGYIAYKVYRMFAAPKSKDPCCGCSGCSLKKELEEAGFISNQKVFTDLCNDK